MAMKKDELLVLLQIYGLSSSNLKLGAITAKAYKELLEINEELQKELDKEAEEEAKKKAEEEAKVKKKAEDDYAKEMKHMEDNAKAASRRA